MNPGVGHLACRPQAVEERGPVDIGQHATCEVVCGRSDGQPLGRRVEADA